MNDTKTEQVNSLSALNKTIREWNKLMSHVAQKQDQDLELVEAPHRIVLRMLVDMPITEVNGLLDKDAMLEQAKLASRTFCFGRSFLGTRIFPEIPELALKGIECVAQTYKDMNATPQQICDLCMIRYSPDLFCKTWYEMSSPAGDSDDDYTNEVHDDE